MRSDAWSTSQDLWGDIHSSTWLSYAMPRINRGPCTVSPSRSPQPPSGLPSTVRRDTSSWSGFTTRSTSVAPFDVLRCGVRLTLAMESIYHLGIMPQNVDGTTRLVAVQFGVTVHSR